MLIIISTPPVETVQFFENNYLIDIRAFYIIIKEYLTSPNYKEQGYAVSLDFLDIVKKEMIFLV